MRQSSRPTRCGSGRCGSGRCAAYRLAMGARRSSILVRLVSGSISMAWPQEFLRTASLRMAASGRTWLDGHAGLSPLRRAPGAKPWPPRRS
jgi:hypothetical protein